MSPGNVVGDKSVFLLYPIPHDLADSDDEDLVNLDIDDGVNVIADVARGHCGDGGGDDRPHPYQVPTGCEGFLGNRGKDQFDLRPPHGIRPLDHKFLRASSFAPAKDSTYGKKAALLKKDIGFLMRTGLMTWCALRRDGSPQLLVSTVADHPSLDNILVWRRILETPRTQLFIQAMSPGNVAREGIPFELFRSTYLGRHVARESYPQRQVARETPDLSPGIVANVVVLSWKKAMFCNIFMFPILCFKFVEPLFEATMKKS
ncbi:hypothetical protein Tco_0888240 [Tanacetum coccineum]